MIVLAASIQLSAIRLEKLASFASLHGCRLAVKYGRVSSIRALQSWNRSNMRSRPDTSSVLRNGSSGLISWGNDEAH
jgi:hypothetical protein